MIHNCIICSLLATKKHDNNYYCNLHFSKKNINQIETDDVSSINEYILGKISTIETITPATDIQYDIYKFIDDYDYKTDSFYNIVFQKNHENLFTPSIRLKTLHPNKIKNIIFVENNLYRKYGTLQNYFENKNKGSHYEYINANGDIKRMNHDEYVQYYAAIYKEGVKNNEEYQLLLSMKKKYKIRIIGNSSEKLDYRYALYLILNGQA